MKLSKHKKIVLASFIVVLLVVSFWYGGNADGLRGFSVSDSKSKATEQISENAVASKSENASESPKESDNQKPEASTEEANFFQKIVMHITKKSGSSSKSSNTQNSKAAQKNANKAMDKSSKSNKTKDKNSSNSNNNKKNNSTTSNNKNNTTTDNSNNQNSTTTDSNKNGNTTSSNTNNNTNTTESNSDTIKCTIYISCAVLLDNMDNLSSAKQKIVPKDGVILKTTTVTVKKDSTVFDVLQKATKANKVSLEYSFTPLYKSYYIEGIGNLYEFDGGELSGWMYSVNGEFPGYGCSSYTVKDGDAINWLYTCNLGKDVGGYLSEE